MPPLPVHPYARKSQNKAIPPDPQEIAHLAVLAADTIEALPPSLTRSLSDLKELDAVLNTALQQVTGKLGNLLDLIEDPNVTPAQRLALLKEVADEAAGFKLGGEDKIRVATGTCETILHHSKQLDLIVSLMTSLMPLHVLELVPASSTPSGYPHLFPSYGSTTAASLYRPRTDFFPPAPTPVYGGPNLLSAGVTRAAQANYNQALSAVQRYQQEGPLPSTSALASARSRAERTQLPPPVRKPPPPVQAPRARTISQQSIIGGMMPQSEALVQPQPHHPGELEAHEAISRKREPAQPVDQDDAANADSPVSVTGTNGRKRPRSTQQPGSASTTAGNSPVGERPPSIGGVSRRRQSKKPSPDPRVPPSSSRERAASGSGRPRRATQTDMAEDVEEPLPAEEEALDGDHVDPSLEGDKEGAPAPGSTGTEPGSNESLYCFCRRVSYGEMIGCDGEDCKIEWFHLACVNLKEPPKGRWICADCQKEERNNPKKRRTQ